jgi:hypothetical protein
MPEQLPVDVPPRQWLSPGTDVTPTRLRDAVLTARAALAQERHLRRRPGELTARAVLLEALEEYVRSLEDRGHPIPYALRDELRLLRLTCATNGRSLPVTTHKEPAHDHSVR